MEKVLVIFEAKDDHVEGLALAFGLGAVQKKSLIRLRHLNPAPDSRLAHQSYGALGSADVQWADGIAIFLEEDAPGSSANLDALRKTLQGTEPSDPARKRKYYVLSENPASSAAEAVAGWLPGGFERFSAEPAAGPVTPNYITQVGQQFASLPVSSVDAPTGS